MTLNSKNWQEVEADWERDIEIKTATKELDDGDENSVPINFHWSECRTDPTPYKQLSPVLIPQGVMVRINVPKKYIVDTIPATELSDEQYIFSVEGMVYVTRKIAQIIKLMYLDMEE